jgi:hypothetical protein
MHTRRLSALVAITLLGTILVGAPRAAEYDPIFDFIPLGGRSLLTKIFESKPPATEVQTLLTVKRSREEWVAHLKGRAGVVAAIKDLDPQELLTLADYLGFNMPLPAARIPADLTRVNWKDALPRDGRDLALDYCQSCHIITVTVTQDRTREHWLGTMNKPSHVGIKLTPPEREALASFLVLNAGISIDQVPPELRAGGASY